MVLKLVCLFLQMLFLVPWPLPALTPPAELDPSFQTRGVISGMVRAIALQADGKVVLGGNFKLALPSGPTHQVVARLNEDGTLDTSFTPQAIYGTSVFSLAIQPDGKILVASDFCLQRLESGGTVDLAFGYKLAYLDAYYSSDIIDFQTGGKILLGGKFHSVWEYGRGYLARLEPDGQVDLGFDNSDGFDAGAEAAVYALAMDERGRILVGGNLPTFRGQVVGPVIRLKGGLSSQSRPRFIQNPISQRVPVGATVENSSLAVGYPSPVYHWFRDDSRIEGATNRTLILTNVTLNDGGNYSIMASNSVGTARADVDLEIGVFNQPGSLDLDFQPCSTRDCDYSETLVGMLSSAKLVVFRSRGNEPGAQLLNPDGTPNRFLITPSALPGLNELSNALWTQQADGKFVLLIRYLSGRNPLGHLTRFEADGQIDESFKKVILVSRVEAIGASSKGFIYLAGAFGNSNSISDVRGVRRLFEGSNRRLIPAASAICSSALVATKLLTFFFPFHWSLSTWF